MSEQEQSAVDVASEDQPPQPEAIVIVRMSAQRGNLNPGDIAGLPASKAATFIREKAAIALVVGVDIDKDANPLRDLSDLVPPADDDSSGEGNQGASNSHADDWKFDARTDPFTTDGLSKQASMALHKQGWHTVEAVRNFIASLPEDVRPVDAVNEVDGVTDAQAEKIVKLYGTVTEHSDE